MYRYTFYIWISEKKRKDYYKKLSLVSKRYKNEKDRNRRPKETGKIHCYILYLIHTYVMSDCVSYAILIKNVTYLFVAKMIIKHS